jgi:hypothetical protein
MAHRRMTAMGNKEERSPGLQDRIETRTRAQESDPAPGGRP